MNKQQKVVVVGATGYLGQYVVNALKEAGYWVRALSRTEQKIDAVRPLLPTPLLFLYNSQRKAVILQIKR